MNCKYFMLSIFIASSVAQDTVTYTEELCRKNNVEELSGDAEIALNDFVDNFFKLFKHNDLKPEQNYCKKAGILQKYLENFAQDVAPCIATEDGSYDATITRTGVVLVLNYMCSKVGDEYKVYTNYSETCFKENLIKCISAMRNIPVTKAALSLSVNDPCGNFNQMSSCVATAIGFCTKDKVDKKLSTTCCKYNSSCEASP